MVGKKRNDLEPQVGKLYKLVYDLRSGQYSDDLPIKSISLLLNLYAVDMQSKKDRVYEFLFNEKKYWVYLTSKELFFDYFESLKEEEKVL